MKKTIQTLLQERPFLILDGAFTTELERQGIETKDELWGTLAILTHPDAVTLVHQSYYEAGADIITTDSYQATLEGFKKKGYTEKESIELLQKTVTLAQNAKKRYQEKTKTKRPLYIAASIGPYGAYLADGSEYTGNYGKTINELARFHRKRMHILAESGADLLACETIPTLTEAKALIQILHELPKTQAWMTFTCQDGSHTAGGDNIEDVAAYIDQEKQIIAMGVNCTAPEHIETLIGKIKTVTKKPIIIYPNSGETWDGEKKEWKGAPRPFPLYIEKWIEAGARLIGGCCRTTPDTIRAIACRRKEMEQEGKSAKEEEI